MTVARIRAIFCDMDGTLLDPRCRVSDYTIGVLKRLKAQGQVYFILCTGRPHPDVFATIVRCGLAPDFVVTSNGARVHDRDFKEIVQHNFDPAVAQQIVRIRAAPADESVDPDDTAATGPLAAAGGRKPFVSNIFRSGQWLTNELVPLAVATFDEGYGCTDLADRFHELPLEELTEVQHFWFQMNLDGSPADLELVGRYMKAAFEARGLVTLTSSDPMILEVGPPGVTKGTAVTEVARLLGVPLDEVACFGDGLNDLPMFEVAGKSFMMDNAPQFVKDLFPAAERIGSNADDAVAKKIEELFSL